MPTPISSIWVGWAGASSPATWRNGWRGPDRDLILDNGTRCPRYYCLRSFVLGTGHVVMLLLAGAAVVAVVYARTKRKPLDAVQHRLLLVAGALLVVYAFSIAFMVTPRTFLRLLPGSYSYIQYPWRLVGMVAFLAATITALLLASRLLPRRVSHLALAVSAIVVLFVPSVQRSPAFERGVDERDLETLIPTRGDRGFTVEGEYLPRGVDAYNIGPCPHRRTPCAR